MDDLKPTLIKEVLSQQSNEPSGDKHGVGMGVVTGSKGVSSFVFAKQGRIKCMGVDEDQAPVSWESFEWVCLMLTPSGYSWRNVSIGFCTTAFNWS